MSSIIDFFKIFFFLFLFFRITALENVVIVASTLQDHPKSVLKKKNQNQTILVSVIT